MDGRAGRGKLGDKSAEPGCQNMTGGPSQLGRLLGQDNGSRTAIARKIKQDGWKRRDRTVDTGQLRQDNYGRTARTGQLGQDRGSWDRTTNTGQM
jgi:hypothetical protein